LEQEHWERKYHLALERMERDEQDFRALEERLRRLGSRLSILARGGDRRLDTLLDRVGEAIRGELSAARLDPLLDALGDAISRMDAEPAAASPMPVASVAAPVAPPITPLADSRWTDALRRVLLGIVLLPEFDERALALRETLANACEDRQLDSLATQIATLVNHQRDALLADMAKLQGLLGEVGGRLDEMSRYLVTELTDQEAGTADGRVLDETVREEMRQLGEQTRQADDLGSLQRQVQSRLTVIDTHFREFREREEARQEAYNARSERMRQRVEELETETVALQDLLRREHVLALTDQLTGMPNRLAYERHVEDQHRRAVADQLPLCLAAFDIDHFKAINDSYGHAAGDAVLKIVGQSLQKLAGEHTFLARYGGEEFVAVFARVSQEQAMALAETLRSTVEALAFHAAKRPVQVTMSGGVAEFSAGDKPHQVFERADRALYAAKAAGRNRCLAG
jgi:diguanylate cyclase